MNRSVKLAALGASALVAALWTVTAVRAADEVQTSRTTYRGTITQRTPFSISIRQSPTNVVEVALNDVLSIRFDGEPAKLRPTRQAARQGRYDDALREFISFDDDASISRAELKEDIAFYKAFCQARLALGGRGDLSTAGRQMHDFVKQFPESHHTLEAHELLGELLAAVGKTDLALEALARLEQAPWAEYKMRAAIAKGRLLRGQAKPAEALAEFERAIALAGSGEGAKSSMQTQVATLGKAACLADQNQFDAAIALVESIVAAANPEDTLLHAQAYNTLGYCQKKAGRAKEALLAYLHVDVLYFNFPQEHAEALRNLAELWNAAGQTERALEAQETLKQRYGGQG